MICIYITTITTITILKKLITINIKLTHPVGIKKSLTQYIKFLHDDVKKYFFICRLKSYIKK